MAGCLSKSQHGAEGKIEKLTWSFSNKIDSYALDQMCCSLHTRLNNSTSRRVPLPQLLSLPKGCAPGHGDGR